MANEDWDIDSYYNVFEPEEQWELKKKFMEAYKHMFDESRLVCLAQVLVNIEFLGCRYPGDTMRQVAELSHGIIEEFRERQKTRLKRTFVGAADAASAKVKGRTPAHINTMQDQTASVNIHFDDRTEIRTKKLKIGKVVGTSSDEAEDMAQSSSGRKMREIGLSATGNGGLGKTKPSIGKEKADDTNKPIGKQKTIDHPVFTKKYDIQQGSRVKQVDIKTTKTGQKVEKKELSFINISAVAEESVDQADDTETAKKKKKAKAIGDNEQLAKAVEETVEEGSSVTQLQVETNETSQKAEKKVQSFINFSQATVEESVEQTDNPEATKKKKKRKKKKAETEQATEVAVEEAGDESSAVSVFEYDLPNFVLVIRENKSVWEGKRENLRARSILNCSASINDLKLMESKKQIGGMCHCMVSLGDIPLAEAAHSDEARSQAMAEKAALEALQKTQYSVLVKDLRDGDVPVTVEGAKEQDEKLPEHNIGFKLLKMMGWSGGGLGSKQQGIVDPIEQKTIVGRSGLGRNSTKGSFELDVRHYLAKYHRSDSNRDLVFATDYSNEERKIIHATARRLGLQSKSHNVTGTDGKTTRQLFVSRRVMKTRSLIQMVRDHISGQQSIKQGAFGDKFEIVPPSSSSS